MMAARSQGLTHFVGRVIDDFGTNQTRIDTEGYKALHKLVNQTCNDTWELFEDIQNFNPYTEKMIKLIEKNNVPVFQDLRTWVAAASALAQWGKVRGK